MSATNSNSGISYAKPEFWADVVQREYFKSHTYSIITRLTVHAILKKGDTINRQILSKSSDFVLTDPSTNITVDDNNLTISNETLTITQTPQVSFNIDDLDIFQSSPEIFYTSAKRMAQRLGDYLDGYVLNELQYADSVLDDGDFGGTDGSPLSVNAANIFSVYTKATRKLLENNVATESDMVSIIPPAIYEKIVTMLAGKENSLGGMVTQHGYKGDFNGTSIYISNNLPFVAVLAIPTQPTATDTLVINGVTLTFVAALAAAGDVHICSDVDNTRANLAALLEAPGTSITEATDAGYTAVSIANQRLLADIETTNSNSADTLTIRMRGRREAAVTETFTAVGNVVSHTFTEIYIGKRGTIDLALQQTPKVRDEYIQGSFSLRRLSRSVFGLKTFADGSEAFVAVQVDTTD